MKKFTLLTATLLITLSILAQTPPKMSYQCVVRNATGTLVTNQAIGIKISILQGSVTGIVVFAETYSPNPQTNSNGLVTLEIGSGTAINGTFPGIDWSAGPYFLKAETDPTGGTNYTIAGTSQLLSVPYALYAKTVENGFSGNYNDLTNRPTLFSGSYNDLTNRPVLFDGAWASLTGKPTTLSGYGITDGMSITHAANNITTTNISNWNTAFGWGNHSGLYRPISYVPTWTEVTNKPTTVAGYGITDAVKLSGDQTIAGNKTFTGTINASNKTIVNVSDPVNNQDVATKHYIDAQQPWIIFQESTQSVIGNNSPVVNTGVRNIFIGKSSGMNNIGGVYNTFIGSEAGFQNTIGTYNVAIGYNALKENDEGSHNIAIGANALRLNKVSSPGSLGGNGFENIAIGENALEYSISRGNTAIGINALRLITDGAENVGVGGSVMRDMPNGWGNTAMGANSMISAANGVIDNVAFGVSAGEHIGSNGNVFVGAFSGRMNQGSNNIFLGNRAGHGDTWQNVSNRLIINNNYHGDDIPLIYGEFDNSLVKVNGSFTIRDILKLTPRSTAPSNPSEGDIYYDSTTHKLMVFNGSVWMACW